MPAHGCRRTLLVYRAAVSRLIVRFRFASCFLFWLCHYGCATEAMLHPHIARLLEPELTPSHDGHRYEVLCASVIVGAEQCGWLLEAANARATVIVLAGNGEGLAATYR